MAGGDERKVKGGQEIKRRKKERMEERGIGRREKIMSMNAR